MSWENVFSAVADAILRRLPGWLLRPLYPQERLQKDLELDIRSTHGLSFSLGHSPNAWCWLRFTNLSPLAVQVLTVEVDVWDQQPLCTLQRQVHERVSGRTSKEIYCTGFLNEWQELRAHQARDRGGTFSVSARLVVATVHGVQEVRFHHKEGVRGDLSGSPAKVPVTAG